MEVGAFQQWLQCQPCSWKLLRGPQALLQLLPPCQEPDHRLPATDCCWDNTGEGVASGLGQRETKVRGLTLPALTRPWSAGHAVSLLSDSANDLFHLKGTECYLHRACSRPRVEKPGTGPGGDRDTPESRSSSWRRRLEMWINSVAAVSTDLWPSSGPAGWLRHSVPSPEMQQPFLFARHFKKYYSKCSPWLYIFQKNRKR